MFRLALRQCEGLTGSIMHMLGIDLAVPDHTTLSRRARRLEVEPAHLNGAKNLHLIVDSTGLKLRGAGDWLQDKHGTGGKCRSWLKLHIGMDAESGEIVTSDPTDKAVDDAAHVPVLPDQISTPIASFLGEGAFDTGAVYETVISRNPHARVIVPPGKDAVPSLNAATAPTQRDKHLMEIKAHGRSKWQQRSGYTRRSKVEVQISRYKRVIGDTLRSRGHPQAERKTDREPDRLLDDVRREPVAAINGFRCRHHRARRADVRRHFVNLTVPLAPHFGPNATGQIVCYRQSDR